MFRTYYSTQAIEVLKDRNQELHVTTKELTTLPTGVIIMEISNQENQSFLVDASTTAYAESHLKHMLKHYPHPATINGAAVERTEPPTLPRVKVKLTEPTSHMILTKNNPEAYQEAIAKLGKPDKIELWFAPLKAISPYPL